MKKLLILGLTSVVSFSLLSCAPFTPQNARTSTGANLDKPASGERSARETRYLEQEVVQSQGNPPATPPVDPNIPLDPNAPAPSDPAQIQAPNPTSTMPPPPATAEAPPPPAQDTPPAPAPSTPAATELPYGVPVPGKKGFVYSPYDKSAGFVDVRDISPGTKVRCPYTGKIFRVP